MKADVWESNRTVCACCPPQHVTQIDWHYCTALQLVGLGQTCETATAQHALVIDKEQPG